jgi:predicted amidophosphoribosyltransferase
VTVQVCPHCKREFGTIRICRKCKLPISNSHKWHMVQVGELFAIEHRNCKKPESYK